MRGYFIHYGTLPPSLENRALFHHINGLNIYRFIQTNGRADDCTLTNFDAWSMTLRSLASTLAPYMLNAFSLLSSPSILPAPLTNDKPLPVPPPEGHSLLACITQVEDAPEDEEDPHSALQ